MIKEDLKTGMLVLLNNGRIFMCVNDALINREGGWIPTDEIEKKGGWSIVKVSEVLHGKQLRTVDWTTGAIDEHLLWERGKTTHIIGGVEYSEQTLLNIIKKVHG